MGRSLPIERNGTRRPSTNGVDHSNGIMNPAKNGMNAMSSTKKQEFYDLPQVPFSFRDLHIDDPFLMRESSPPMAQFMGRPAEEGPLVGQQNHPNKHQHMGLVTTMCSTRTREEVEYMSRNFGDNRPGEGTRRCAPLALDENGRPLSGNRLAYGYDRHDDQNQDELRNGDDGDHDEGDDDQEELGDTIDLVRNTPQVALPFRESTVSTQLNLVNI